MPRIQRTLALLGLMATAWLGAALAHAVTDEERAAVHGQFLAAFGRADYEAALPLAEQLVSLTEEQFGPDNRAIAVPLTNLGTTLYRLQRFDAAQRSYERAIGVLEKEATTTDRDLLRPLQGLGMSYASTDQPARAAVTLKRAIDLSRNLDGLYNPEQLEFLRALISAYVTESRIEEAERENKFAFRVAEMAYGPTDPRMIVAYEELAQWYEYVGNFPMARDNHVAALSLAFRTSGRGSLQTVAPLRGIARTHLAEFIANPEGTAVPVFPTMPGVAPSPVASDGMGGGTPNPQGERALREALAVVEKQQPADDALMGSILVQLGDWYFVSQIEDRARRAWREGWQVLSRAGDTSLLAAPRQLRYRAPSSSVTRFQEEVSVLDYDEYAVAATFTVDASGKVTDVVIDPTSAPERARRSVETALKRALYAPRVENGETVATPGVTWTERMLVRKTPEKPPEKK